MFPNRIVVLGCKCNKGFFHDFIEIFIGFLRNRKFFLALELLLTILVCIGFLFRLLGLAHAFCIVGFYVSGRSSWLLSKESVAEGITRLGAAF